MQQGLWTYINPFDRRFGPEFFRQIPETPGVYWMQDAKRCPLYVGKSINLRRRLSSYRYIKPHKSPKRLIKLMDEVRNLGWSATKTEKAALLLENEMLKRCRPAFNILGVSVERYVYVHFRAHYPSFNFSLSSQRSADPNQEKFGVFRSRHQCHKTLSAMTRLLWWLGHQGEFQSLPKPLAKPLSALNQNIFMESDEKSFSIIKDMICEYWSGTSTQLLQVLKESLVPWANASDPFVINWISTDLEILESYFTHGPAKNQRLRTLFQMPEDWIEPEWIDDLIILADSPRA